MGNKRSRDILKSFFRLGNTPTSAQFEDLIDSIVNIADDGQVRTSTDGLLLYPVTENGRMASIYSDPGKLEEERRMPCWSFKIGQDKELLLVNQDGQVIVSVSQEKGPEVYDTPQPRVTSSTTRYSDLPADGEWHDLPIKLPSAGDDWGSRILRITAAYRTGKNKYRMITLTASYCTRRHLKISPSQHRFFFFWKSPLRLRWKKQKDGVSLQIKGKRKKHGESAFHYQVKEEWNYCDTDK